MPLFRKLFAEGLGTFWLTLAVVVIVLAATQRPDA